LSKSKSSSYDANIFDNLFLKNYKIKKKLNKFEKSEILLIGGTKQLQNINIIKNKFLLATLNYNAKINQKIIDYVFICNPYRIITEINLIKNKKIIIPNIKVPIKEKKNHFIYYNIDKNENFLIKLNLA
jgi:hypothetical protein